MPSDRYARLDRILERQNEQLALVERTLARQERAFQLQVRTFDTTIALLEGMLDRLDGPSPETGG